MMLRMTGTIRQKRRCRRRSGQTTPGPGACSGVIVRVRWWRSTNRSIRSAPKVRRAVEINA